MRENAGPLARASFLWVPVFALVPLPPWSPAVRALWSSSPIETGCVPSPIPLPMLWACGGTRPRPMWGHAHPWRIRAGPSAPFHPLTRRVPAGVLSRSGVGVRFRGRAQAVLPLAGVPPLRGCVLCSARFACVPHSCAPRSLLTVTPCVYVWRLAVVPRARRPPDPLAFLRFPCWLGVVRGPRPADCPCPCVDV